MYSREASRPGRNEWMNRIKSRSPAGSHFAASSSSALSNESSALSWSAVESDEKARLLSVAMPQETAKHSNPSPRPFLMKRDGRQRGAHTVNNLLQQVFSSTHRTSTVWSALRPIVSPND